MNWLQRQAKTQPDEVALTVGDVDVTWLALTRRVQRTAAALNVAGVGPGSRVAALADSGVNYVALAWAAMWTGATLIPLNSRLTDATLSWQLQHCRAELLVIDQGAANRSLDLGNIRFVSIEDLTYSRASDAVPFVLDTPGTMLYTSGTSGPPRLVRLTWRNHMASATASAMNLGVQPEDNWLCCLPLYHIGGLAVFFRSAIYGTRATLLDRFDAAEVVSHLERDISIVSLVPTMLRRLADVAGGLEELADRLAAGRLRAILLGGGAADPAFVGACLDAGLPVIQTYGMTEACSQIATIPPALARDKLGSSGFPVLGAEVEIRTEEGLPRACGPGVIWVRGPMVTSGYVNAPDARDRFLGGWFKTGDIGELDEDGFLWVHGRHDDVIVTGGEKVAPTRVEQVIVQHPSVDEVAVFGVTDPQWGQRVVAAVVTDATVEDLNAWCREHLGDYERPRDWRFVEALPRTSTGKVRRNAL